MNWLNILQIIFIAAGCLFFIAGTVGLMRFPDVYTRIHALTKADNLGLGLIVLGLLPGVAHISQGAKLVLIWLVVLAASSTAGFLIARHTHRTEENNG